MHQLWLVKKNKTCIYSTVLWKRVPHTLIYLGVMGILSFLSESDHSAQLPHISLTFIPLNGKSLLYLTNHFSSLPNNS